MAEFCIDCWNRITGEKEQEKKYILSGTLDLCEGCGEWKPVVVRLRSRYIVKKKLEDCFARFRKRK